MVLASGSVPVVNLLKKLTLWKLYSKEIFGISQDMNSMSIIKKDVYTYAEASQNLGSICDQVILTRREVVIKHPDKEDIAVLPAVELEEMKESLHLLGSPRNASRLFAAISRARSQSLPVGNIDDLSKSLGLD
ncbi:MAG: type II toxin-antitoxin system Phd/YefM family antitoxin [Limnospira sp. PMC 917.15]|nr:type II toxin-antitoxin system Phd/YefM family antitoxin [Limnospira sp. PMC 917.15]